MKVATFPREWKVAWGDKNNKIDRGDNSSWRYFETEVEAQAEADRLNALAEKEDWFRKKKIDN